MTAMYLMCLTAHRKQNSRNTSLPPRAEVTASGGKIIVTDDYVSGISIREITLTKDKKYKSVKSTDTNREKATPMKVRENIPTA
jgi:sorbitol-specific phosphotransferase system component IIBC